MTEYQPRIMISGETGGTGASTTAKLLAKHLDLPTISGGKYYRGIAHQYNKHLKDHAGLPDEQNYQDFFQIYNTAFQASGIDAVHHLIGDGLTEGAKGDVVAQFETAIQTSYRKTGKMHKVWDYVVDKSTIRDALSTPGFVWEGKIAILALELDQMQEVIPQNEFSNTPYLKALLHLDSQTAAKRVGQREGRKVDAKEIEDRKHNDYARYGNLYTINNHPVTHRDLSKYADIKIDTKRINPEGVAKLSLTRYLEQIETIGNEYQILALPMIRNIQSALKSL